MADRRLARSVHVDGHWYRAGDTVPDDIAEKITNPRAFAADDDIADPDERVEPGTDSGARLAGRVHVDGRWYGPDTPVPDDVAKKITNPKAWATTEPVAERSDSQPGDGPDVPPTPGDGDGDGGPAARPRRGGNSRR